MRTVIVDLDGTLADVAHRLPSLGAGKRKNWQAFFSRMHLDPLNEWCKLLMAAMHKEGYRIAIVSGRPDGYAEVIREWLGRHAVPYDELYLRREGDVREDTIVKRELLREHFQQEDVLFAVDDRPQVVAMWRSEGIVCLQCQ